MTNMLNTGSKDILRTYKRLNIAVMVDAKEKVKTNNKTTKDKNKAQRRALINEPHGRPARHRRPDASEQCLSPTREPQSKRSTLRFVHAC